MEWDALVIGAGPVGSLTGGYLSQKGLKVLILEEHKEIGKPMACGGLISPKITELTPFSFPIQNKINGAFISGPDGNELEFFSPKTKAVVIDRTRFDCLAAKWAVSQGAKINLGSRVTGLKIGVNNVRARLSNRMEISSRIVLGADGPGSITAKAAGLPEIKEIVTGVELEAIGEPRKKEHVELFLGKDFGTGFFSWVIPVGKDKLRIGTGAYHSTSTALQSLKHLICDSRFTRRFGKIQPLSYHSGGIPIGMRNRLYSDRLLVLGDAAGLAKPVSGGGIITGLISAKIVSDTVANSFDTGDFSKQALAAYQRELRHKVWKELRRAMRLRKAFMFLPDSELKKLMNLLSRDEVIKLINEKGDIDYPGKLSLELIRRSPQLLPFGLKHLGKSYFG